METLLFDGGDDLAGEKSRQRLVRAAVIAFQTHGYHASGLTEILSLAGLPKGSLYHHFPGGKPELAAAAVGWLASTILDAMAKARQKGLTVPVFLERLARDAGHWLEQRDYGQGALLAVLAQETAAGEPLVADAVGAAYAAICGALSDWLKADGSETETDGTASAALAMLDGAIAQARAARSIAPMEAAARALTRLLSP